MLDPRIYRAALVPVLLALIVAAFSLESRPRPIGTTLAPDAFDGSRAGALLDDLAREFPERRAGSAGDDRLARRVAQGLRVLGGSVRLQRFEGDTPDGAATLVNVIGTRPGQPGPGIVVVAHRDAAGRVAKPELSGTAALLELARVAGDGRLRRSVTFVSTTGGSGGAAGAAALARRLAPADVDAVLVLGDLAGERVRKPFVIPWSNGGGQAPLRLRRTIEAAVRAEAGTDPGGFRAAVQWARLAFPLAAGEQGELNRAGLPAVLLQVSGERGPDAAGAIVPRRLETFGRAALRTLYALDNGPAIATGPQEVVVTQRKVLPGWAVRLLVGALLLPPLALAVDGLARLRRRRQPVGRWLLWALGGALPFAAAGGFALALGGTGLVDSTPPAPLGESALELDGAAHAALASIGLIFVLGWLALRPLALRALGAAARPREPGAGLAVLLCLTAVAVGLWATNPFAAAFVVPALHLWLPVLAPELRMPRVAGLALVALALVPLGAVAAAGAAALGLGPLEAAWSATLLVAGAHVNPLTWLAWCVMAGCAVGTGLVALAGTRGQDESDQGGSPSVRGPAGYAGPGSLGGTESAMRR